MSKNDNQQITQQLIDQIWDIAKGLSDVHLMEVCGTHTMSIARYGLKSLLPKNVELISGPGCPVCVTPNEQIDKMIALAKRPHTIITTFGDMMRVPGSTSSLTDQQAKGANIKIVYSQTDALKIAKENPTSEVVFLGVGFETTTPGTASVIRRAKIENISNFSVMCAHKNMPNALALLLDNNNVKINGFLLPGHVSTIIGTRPYEFIAKKYNVGGVIAGFSAHDILLAIKMLLEQLKNSTIKIENAYTRAVKPEGNIAAVEAIDKVFETCDCTWRGLGVIKNSGYKIKDEFKAFDAQHKFNIEAEKTIENKGCKCGDVLQGKIQPANCPLFGKSCTPQNPVGPCMVSSEGSCAATYSYTK